MTTSFGRAQPVRDCFFFSSRRRHTSSLRDWSSDVCSSDLDHLEAQLGGALEATLFADARRGAVVAEERALAAEPERTLGVGADHAGSGLGERVAERVRVRLGHEHHELELARILATDR